MLQAQQAGATPNATSEPFEAVEFELALDLQDPAHASFEDCVRTAAAVVGGEILFDMPADGTVEDASRIAAVRIAHETGDRILFAVFDEAEGEIRAAGREEIGERFHGFAQAFVGVLERIREDLARTMPTVAGSA